MTLTPMQQEHLSNLVGNKHNVEVEKAESVIS